MIYDVNKVTISNLLFNYFAVAYNNLFTFISPWFPTHTAYFCWTYSNFVSQLTSYNGHLVLSFDSIDGILRCINVGMTYEVQHH